MINDVKQQPKIRYDMLQSNDPVASSLDTLSDNKQQPKIRYDMLQSNDPVASSLDTLSDTKFTIYDTRLPVFETIGVQCNKCFTDLYILWDCFDYTHLPINYRGYRVKPFRSRAAYAEQCCSKCKCGNVGIIKDSDNDLHVYVDDIRTVTVYNYYIRTTPNIIGNYDLIHKDRLGRSEELLYVDYSKIKHTELSSKIKYTPPAPKQSAIPSIYSQNRTNGSLGLMKALDNYKDFHANKWHTLPGIAK